MPQEHYSYALYADPEMARTFDERRFGGPIGELVAAGQAAVLAGMAGPVAERRVLDVGTGTGRAALLLARRGARVTGIDASEQMLAVARERAAAEGLPITFSACDVHAIDFPDRSFDLVVSLRVLMHSPQWRDALGELCRVSAADVIFDYPSARSAALVQSWARRVRARFGGRTEPYRVFSHREVIRALAACGFRVRAVHRQFVLPIALHKAVGSKAFTIRVEAALDRVGLLGMFGSPVTVVAERCATS